MNILRHRSILIQMDLFAQLKCYFFLGAISVGCSIVEKYKSGSVVWRRRSLWRVVVAPEARALRPFLCSECNCGAGLGSVFDPPNARFEVSCLVGFIYVILRLSCIHEAQVIF